MKYLLVFIFLIAFSIMAFAQKEELAEKPETNTPYEKAHAFHQADDEASQEKNARPAETELSNQKKKVTVEEKSETVNEQDSPVEVKLSDKKKEAQTDKMVKEESKPEKMDTSEKEKTFPTDDEASQKQKAIPAETELSNQKKKVTVEEKSETISPESDNTGSAASVQAGVKYECDENMSYTLYEPGTQSENHLCELDAGHTEIPADWYALHESSFCRQKLQDMIRQYNCVATKYTDPV